MTATALPILRVAEDPSGLLTKSRASTARSCAREHHLRYEQMIVPIKDEDGPLGFGTLVHGALEVYWLAVKAGDDRATDEAVLSIQRAEADDFDKAKALAMVSGYAASLEASGFWARFEVVEVEPEFRCDLRNPETGAPSRTWTLAGKIDGIVRERATGLLYLVEHKTSGEDVSPGSPYWGRLRLDPQIGIYYRGAAALGYEVSGCVYDVLAKPRIRPAKATPEDKRQYTKAGALYANQRDRDETPDEYLARCTEAIASDPAAYYVRGEVHRFEDELAGLDADLWSLGRMIREGQLAGRAPRNPDACQRYGRWCSYFDVCTGDADLDDPTKFTRLESPHPELAG